MPARIEIAGMQTRGDDTAKIQKFGRLNAIGLRFLIQMAQRGLKKSITKRTQSNAAKVQKTGVLKIQKRQKSAGGFGQKKIQKRQKQRLTEGELE